MKYIIEYDNYINENMENLNEGFFANLWSKFRYGGKVKKMATQIADLRFTLQKRELEIKNKRMKEGLDPNSFTEAEIAELKTYEDEATNLEQQIEHNYGDQEVLMKLSKSTQLERENQNIQKLRSLAKEPEDKNHYSKVQELNKKELTVINQQLNIAQKFRGDFNAIDYKNKKEIEKRNKLLQEFEKERLKLNNEKLRNEGKFVETKTREIVNKYISQNTPQDNMYDTSSL